MGMLDRQVRRTPELGNDAGDLAAGREVAELMIDHWLFVGVATFEDRLDKIVRFFLL